MELKKGYKQSDVGVIPSDWEVKAIGTFTDISVGRDLKLDNFSNYQDDRYKYPVYSNTVSDYGLYGYYDIPEYEGDSLTIVGRGVGLGCAFARNGGYGAIGRLIVLFPYENVDARFVTEYVNHRVKIFSESGGIPQLTGLSIAKYRIPLPPTKSEQTAIATALSDADALITSLEKLIAKKRNIKQGAMQQLLKAKKGWMVKKLGELGKCHRGVSYNPDSDLYPHDKDSTLRLLRSNNIQDQQLEFNDLQYVDASRVKPNQILQKNDIIICMANGSKQLVGKAATFKEENSHKYTFGAFMGCFRVDEDSAFSSFVALTFHSYQYRSFIDVLLSGSSINNLNPSNIESIEIPLPPKEEQLRISTVISEMQNEILGLQSQLEKYRLIKRGMMQNLLTGKIRLV